MLLLTRLPVLEMQSCLRFIATIYGRINCRAGIFLGLVLGFSPRILCHWKRGCFKWFFATQSLKNLSNGNFLLYLSLTLIHWILIKVFFPLQPDNGFRSSEHRRNSEIYHTFELQKNISINNASQMFEALTLKDANDKTPLHLAIDNNHLW